MIGEPEESDDEKPKKNRRCIMNVHCTEYDIVSRVAKKLLNFRIRDYEEDHDGAVVNGEGNKRLRQDWDITWHDLGITADFLAKMMPY